MQFKASKTEPPVGALITLEAVKASVKDKVNVKWDNQVCSLITSFQLIF